MKILLTGAAGQLGRELKHALAPLGELIACDRAALDLADEHGLRRRVRDIAPALIVNAAAYTAVDKAEGDEAAATAINATAPGVLADEAMRLGARLIHFSTDYVFDGSGLRAWRETDATGPLSAYGRSKLAGEAAIRASGAPALILRTSWVFGLFGANFMNTMRRLATTRDELRIVADQHGAPTWTRHLAAATALLAARPDAVGSFHLCNAGQTSWAGFAEAIFAECTARGLLDRAPRIVPIATADYPTPARRPANSRLDCTLLAQQHGIALPDWRSALADCLADARFPG